MESLFYPGSETWSNADQSQTSSRCCLVDEGNWSKTKRQDVNSMRLDQSRKRVQRHPFSFEAEMSGAKFTENGNFSSPRPCFNQRAREPSLRVLACGMRRHAVHDCVTEPETKRPRLFYPDQGHREILIARMKDTKTQRLFQTREEIVRLLKLRRMQERRGEPQTPFQMQTGNLTSSVLTSCPKSVNRRLHIVPNQGLCRLPYEEETSPSTNVRSIPGINVILGNYACRSNTTGGYALDHHSLPRIIAVHSVTKDAVAPQWKVSQRTPQMHISAGVSAAPTAYRSKRACQWVFRAEQELRKRTELEARNRQCYQNLCPRTLGYGGLAECDYAGAGVVSGTEEIGGSARLSTTAVESEQSNYDVIDLTNCDESTEISGEVLSENCGGDNTELVDNRVREFSEQKCDHSQESDQKCDYLGNSERKTNRSEMVDRKFHDPRKCGRKYDHPVVSQRKCDHREISERKSDHPRESDGKFDHHGNSGQKCHHPGISERKCDHPRQSDGKCDRPGSSDQKCDHPGISERKSDHPRESDGKFDHPGNSDQKCDHPGFSTRERDFGSPSRYLPVVGKSQILKEGDDASPQPPSNFRRHSEPCTSTTPPKLTKTIPEIIDKLNETRERMKLETIDWKKKVLFRLEKVLMKKLRRVESKTAETCQIEGLHGEDAETERGNKGKKKKGERRRSRQQSGKHAERLGADEQSLEKDRNAQNPNDKKDRSSFMQPGQQNSSSDGEESKKHGNEITSREAATRDTNTGLEWKEDRVITVCKEVRERMDIEETPRTVEDLEGAASGISTFVEDGAQESKSACNLESVRRNEQPDAKYERYPEHCSTKLNRKQCSYNGDESFIKIRVATKGDDKQNIVAADDEEGNYPLPKNEKRIVGNLSKHFKNTKDFRRESRVMSPKSDERAASTVKHSSAPLSCIVPGKNQARNNINSIDMVSCDGKLLAVSKGSAGKTATCVRNLWTTLEKNGIFIDRKH